MGLSCFSAVSFSPSFRSVMSRQCRHFFQTYPSRCSELMTCFFVRTNRGISFMLTSIVFHVIPTALEITMVCGILVCCLLEASSKSSA